MSAPILQHPSAPVKFDPPPMATRPVPVCPDCLLPMRFHRGVTGTRLTCEIAQYAQRVIDHPKNPERWADPRPAMTAAVRAAMVDGTCGPALEICMASFTNDEQLAIAYALANVAISAYVADLAKRGK